MKTLAVASAVVILHGTCLAWGNFNDALKTVKEVTDTISKTEKEATKAVDNFRDGGKPATHKADSAPVQRTASTVPAPTAESSPAETYNARLSAVKEGLDIASAKMPLRDHYQEMYNAAYGFLNTDRQFSFLPPEQRAQRTSPEKMKLVDEFIVWTGSGAEISSTASTDQSGYSQAQAYAGTPRRGGASKGFDQNTAIQLRTTWQSRLNTARQAEEITVDDYKELNMHACNESAKIVSDESAAQYEADMQSRFDAKKSAQAERKARIAADQARFREEQAARKQAEADRQAEFEARQARFQQEELKSRRAKQAIQDRRDAERQAEFEAAQARHEKEEREEREKCQAMTKLDNIKRECQQIIGTDIYLCVYSDKANAKKHREILGFFEQCDSVEKATEYKNKLSAEVEALKKLPDSNDEAALIKAYEDKVLCYDLERKVAKRLAEISTDPAILVSLFNNGGFYGKEQDDIAARLGAMADKISDTNIVVTLLSSSAITDDEQRRKLISRLPCNDALELVKTQFDKCHVDDWNENKMAPFRNALALMHTSNDGKAISTLVSLILAKIADFESRCKESWTLRWADEDVKKAEEIVKGFPKLEDAVLEEVICSDETSWRHFINAVSEDMAYRVLAGGKAKSDELEVELAKKLPGTRIDMPVYTGARSSAAKAELEKNMTTGTKIAVAMSAKNAYNAVCEKAAEAAKNTFVLDGFYLGMDIKDAKTVLRWLFRDLAVKEGEDGRGDDADFVIKVAGQKSPFCYARKSDGKVYQFNFGKDLLTKWYDFDVQTYIEWAVEYGSRTGFDMRPDPVSDDTSVAESDGSATHTVYFTQEAYRYKNNKQHYRVSYFGKSEMTTGHSGLGDAALKAEAAADFRYIGGDQGSLRVQVWNK